MEKYKYRAFISYDHKDEQVAARLHRMLEAYPVPKSLSGRQSEKISPIFRDVAELTAHHSLSDKIQDAISQSQYLIVLCSPGSKSSHWVNQEIRLFREVHGNSAILCALIEGTPQTSFPPALLESGEEPLAANLSPKSFRLGVSQLAASILGVGLDDLVQRDVKKLRRRVTLITASAISALLIMGSLTWTAIDARQLAEQRGLDAEGQIEFMLTDLKDELDAVGSLKALNVVGERAASYYDNYKPSDHDDNALGRRARVFHYLGETQRKLGNFDEANRYFQDAYLATQNLLERDPNNPDRIFEHSQSAFWVADSWNNRSKLNEAKPFYQAYHDLAKRIYEIEGGTDRAQAELGSAYHNLGNALLDEKSSSEAMKFLTKASLFKRNLVENDPSNISKTISLANSCMAIGGVHMLDEKISEALLTYTRCIKMLIDLESHFNDENSRINFRKLKIYRILARQHLLSNDTISSKIYANRGVAISKDLMRIDATNVNVLFEDILLHFNLFELAYLQSDADNSKDIAKQINLKIAMFPDSLKDDYSYDVLVAIGLNTDLLMTSLLGNGDQVASQVKGSLSNAGLDQFESLKKYLYYTDTIILVDAILEASQSKILLKHMCNDSDLDLGFRRKVSLSAYMGSKDCPNARSSAPFPISSVEKFLISMPNVKTQKN